MFTLSNFKTVFTLQKLLCKKLQVNVSLIIVTIPLCSKSAIWF